MGMHKTTDITFEDAKAWYNTAIEDFEKLSLNFFDKEKLECKDYKGITTYGDALRALDIIKTPLTMPSCDLLLINRAASAMFKLMIIREALNLGEDLYITKTAEDSCIYYPYNPFITDESYYCKNLIACGDVEIIGKFNADGVKYYVLGGSANNCSCAEGLGGFHSDDGVGFADTSVGLLGCASKEIAEHFGKYFGMLITKAKYGNLVDFEIIEDKYGNA